MNRDEAMRALLQECRSVHDDADRTLQNALARLHGNRLYRAALGQENLTKGERQCSPIRVTSTPMEKTTSWMTSTPSGRTEKGERQDE